MPTPTFRKRKNYMTPERKEQFELAREEMLKKLAALKGEK